MSTYERPGVYIEEVTGPGVITGVGTSTAAFIGPAARGPLFTAKVITNFDEYRRIFGRAGDEWPYLFGPDGKPYYLGHGVRGFFENGGTRAVIVRVGSSTTASWTVSNDDKKEVFQLEALADGEVGNGYRVTISASGPAASVAPILAYIQAKIAPVSDPRGRTQVEVTYKVDDKVRFIVGDAVAVVASDGAIVSRHLVLDVSTTDKKLEYILTLDGALAAAANLKLQMAPISDTQRRIRVVMPLGDIQAGSLVTFKDSTGESYYSIVERTDADGFVYLRHPFQDSKGDPIPIAAASFISISSSPRLKNLDFGVTVTSADGRVLDREMGLSLDPFHAGCIFRKEFQSVRVRPHKPPATRVLSKLQIPVDVVEQDLPKAKNDDPSKIDTMDYERALKTLEDVDDVNIVCVPDAADLADAAQSIVQRAVITHCSNKKDRIAVLDVPRELPPANDQSALSHRDLVTDSGGFAALYYPWLLVPEPSMPGMPRPSMPRSISVPPSGHIAGIFARTDQNLGVHYAPANTEVRGVMGLERVISDREQALINLKGVNALRIFPGDGRVVVWGARTTVPQEGSDWAYVNVRRLMLYIEESIEEGIRWAVFKPNDRPLWKSLKRTISDFLERVYRDGGLVGKTREQAYQVRIDEGLNQPADIAKGRLYIEVKVAPVRPAEFIIVRIGLWDGGAEVVET